MFEGVLRRYVNRLQVLLLWVVVLPGLALARDDSLFWKVESKTATVYLFGSIHIGSPDLYPLPEPVEQAFAASDHLVLEIDLTRIDQSEVALLTQSLGLLADGTTLRTLLPAEVHAAAAAELQRLGLDIALFQRMKPWLFAMTLMQLGMASHGYSPEQGVDQHFARRAGARQVIGLETVAEQLNLFDAMTDAQQLSLLKDYLHDLAETEETIAQLLAAYRRHDAKWLRDYLFEPMRDDPAYASLHQVLIDRRNENMARQIDGMLRGEGSYFVVVGAAHLFGEQGIAALLRQRGHRTVPQFQE